MQTIIPAIQVQPEASLTVEASAFLGENTIRRALGRSIGYWTGSHVGSTSTILGAGQSETVGDQLRPVQAFIAVSSAPLQVTVNNGQQSFTFQMTKLLIMDPAATSIVFHNTGSALVSLKVHFLMGDIPPSNPG